MPFEQFDRRKVLMKPLRERLNRVVLERDVIDPSGYPETISDAQWAVVKETAKRIVVARQMGRPRMLCFGAHTIKNGLSKILIRLMEDGWVTHLATNGAGIIHDWEFAFQGATSEDVRENMRKGEFGTWEETGYYLNAALLVGAYRGLGYGESIGAFVENESLLVPDAQSLEHEAREALAADPSAAAAAADLLCALRRGDLEAGEIRVPHPFKSLGVQAAAYRLNIPFTGHPMIGHDILYMHPLNCCAAIGRAAERDFLCFAHAVSQLERGVYLSIGSAVMSPMVFEKSMAMAQNRALQKGEAIDNHFIAVVDLAKSQWDWTQGEPPEDNPDYYLRYNKTFSRMGGTMRYVSSDNRDFLLGLLRTLESDGAP